MSIDAGGLAQMTYSNNFASPNGGIGAPTAGFASRGKGSQLKRLSVASPPKIGSITEDQVDNPTPRTSRSHLLAGLRTAPKTPTAPPASAPYNMSQHPSGFDSAKYTRQSSNGMGQGVPQTATGAGFGMNCYNNPYAMNAGQQYYSLPEQVLAPPQINYGGPDDEPMDPNVLAQLMATEMYLAQRQQQLQQQLLQVQMQGLNLGGQASRQSQQFPMTPASPQGGMYNQMLPQGMTVIQEVPGQPGVYLALNHLTSQMEYITDPSAQRQQQTQLANSPPPPTPTYLTSPSKPDTPSFQVSPPHEVNRNPFNARSTSPPKGSPSPPQDVTPLPPPSANAFRRGHKKSSSLAFNVNTNAANSSDGPKSAFTRSSGFPQTPTTGTFGPGQNRAGEHPIRQPRNPPPMEELVSRPTSKHEGSKNFSARQRRRAVHNLVRAGIERRGVLTGSGGSMTPVSENEITFSTSSDNDSDSGSGSLSGKPSIGSLRAAANGVIGSERKEMERLRDRKGSGDANGSYSATSVSSDEGTDVRGEDGKPAPMDRRNKTPLLVLTNAEKRKSSIA
ncbi:hypothetical protein BDY21DRAFT_277157 [Lineolata rhizophorae]|uniref:Uncharacterized protein n=1 Tax=Lineolata rhizophorae TaxID=578093 RepID=A0A6A6PE31_9PEZI|nr:hypothetical protein BDY21DRAFT_277157 [Lineolata rhizophorae]